MSKRTRKVQFSNKTVSSIINKVKQHPVLWDSDHEHYNVRFKIATAWKDIATSLELPEHVLRTKWKNLRDVFLREIKRCYRHPEHISKWQFFHEMSFLKFTVDTSFSEDNDDVIELVVKDEFEDQNYEQEDPLQYEKTNTYRIKNPRENYDVLFLKSLVPYFKELRPERKLVMRNKIQELLINEIAVESSNNFII